jgi:capsular polysaccharide biosynthesis protein
MNFLLSPPTNDDLIRLLKAWRFWLLMTIIGAVAGATVYVVSPPPFRARASVLVDFNLEQTWPEETDRQLFYYLERETRKLEELAWSDTVMETVSEAGDISIEELRNGVLILSQPGSGGWHFYADHHNARTASTLASTWVQAFAESVEKIEKDHMEMELNQNIQVEITQATNLPKTRRTSLSTYIFTGAISAMVLGALLVLFIQPKEKQRA